LDEFYNELQKRIKQNNIALYDAISFAKVENDYNAKTLAFLNGLKIT
jgi:hypothetical protein